jgi:hypothetical protein
MSLSSSPEEPSQKPPPGRGLLFAGVAAAALMGVGLGLWARPAMSERSMAAPLAIEAPKILPTRMLQIVVEDAPAAFGEPIEVLPASRAPVFTVRRPEPQPEAEPLAPVRPRTGLVRVQSVEPEPAEAAPPPRPARKVEPKPAPHRLAPPPKPVKTKAVAPPKVKPAPKLEKVKVVEKPKPPAAKVAKAAPKPARANVRLAKADLRPPPARVEKAVVKRTAKAVRPARAVERVAPSKAAVAAKPQRAKLEIRKPKAIRPPVQKVVQQAKPARPAKAAPVTALKPAKGAGPLRVAKAQPRPDTAIRDADRQMNRAYSSARAAGVPDWQLRKQQARWEAARASAAREAPWAVHDVYLARIAELHDLTKDAQASGY